MARSVELVRSDIPKKHVEIDFSSSRHAVSSGANFAKLFGVTSLADPSQVNLNYRYTLTQVADELGFTYWSKANDLIKALKDQTGFNMKASDNKYHITMRVGKAVKSVTNKYSEAAVDLLRAVLNGEKYELDTQPIEGSKRAKIVSRNSKAQVSPSP